MATKSRKKLREAARNEREGKQIMKVVLISTVVLVALLYFVFVNS